MRNPTEQVSPAPEQELNTGAGVMPDIKAAFHQDDRKQSGVIVTSELPPNLVEVLKCFDQDGDGNLDLDEIAEAARVYQATKDKAKMYKKMAIALFALLCAYTAALGGMIFAIVDANKENENNAGGAMVDRKTGSVVQTISHETSEEKVLWHYLMYTSHQLSGVKTIQFADPKSPEVKIIGYVNGWKEHGDRSSNDRKLLATFASGEGLIISKDFHEKSITVADHQEDWWKLPLTRKSSRELNFTRAYSSSTHGQLCCKQGSWTCVPKSAGNC